mmetsp:Transcript_5911/g.7805  ORF Transcript_5911/g.7805 Transcript_5911/m.7805 type:complete len:302 (-) Transcript_5911:418-1323(-)|eukprot:CAMPEP_0117757828 /NCGR_PEP_ID=MMETSP0947-20121206/14980_1 /TAXON_ID=44440 /ORGANISM="Chattonella subsalsa, Strain CCMP2191" /LENGTH=301 /DNA_ID=CAMNT_0005577829 /DNA_START=155 /DNA_END=1060 /DNA_ORIENTATION=+
MLSFFSSSKKSGNISPRNTESRGPELTNGKDIAINQLVTQVDADGNQIIQKDQYIEDESDVDIALCTCNSVSSCLPFMSRMKGKNSRNASENIVSAPSGALLPPPLPEDKGLITLVLDLDETLVHGSLEPIESPDLIVPCELNRQKFEVYIRKRPGVENFLSKVGEIFEVVVYTASMGQYASKVVAEFDTTNKVKSQLYRESCIFTQRGYVKDLSRLSRDLKRTIIVDNSHESVMFQPENAIVCVSFFEDPDDIELDLIGDFLESIKDVKDVRQHLHKWDRYRINRLNEMGRDPVAYDEMY